MYYDNKCETCDREFGSQQAAIQHMNALDHWGPRYECDTCDREFFTQQAANQHMNDTDHWKAQFECDTCDQVSFTQRSADQHMDDTGHWEPQYDCDTCNRRFHTQMSANQHMDALDHHKQNYCDSCSRTFQSKNTLKMHLNSSIHRGRNVALERERECMMSCRWDFTQQRKWQKFEFEHAPINTIPESADGANGNPPYTDDEKLYLRKHWRSEYHFLRKHGYSIYREEDRAEGRSILRTFRDKDASEEKSGNDGLKLEDYQADLNLSFSQLECIEQCYGNSENFMSSYEVKCYDSDDLREAKAIADAIRAQEG